MSRVREDRGLGCGRPGSILCEEDDRLGCRKEPKKWKFRVRWLGYEPEVDTMLDWVADRNLAALDEYSKENPHINLGRIDVLGVKSGRIIEKNTGFHGVLQNPRYL